MHVTEWGAQDNPRVLICVHGLTRCGRDFDTLAAALENDYRILCPDVVGRGESDWLANKADYNYPQYIADMVRLIARTHVKQVHWLGTSMGGIIGMLLAAQPHSPITRMVINDVGSHIPKEALARIGKYMDPKATPVFASVDEAVATVRAVSPFGPLSDSAWRSMTLNLLKRVPSGFQFRYDPAIALPFKGGELADIDLSPFWNEVHCPVLVTRGAESDLLLKSTFDEMCAKPQVRGVEFAETGHAPMFQDAESISQVRAFLLG
jgi:pimeloyl-ACP methyl ester carboxylesterase